MEEELNFSVLMSVYVKDDPVLFHRAVQSVFDNSLQPAEIVLVVDGPVTAQLEAVIEEFLESPKLTVVRLKENEGLAKALNIGLNLIKTKFVFRADSDDFNLPFRFASQARLLLDGYHLVGGAILEVDRHGVPLGKRLTPVEHTEIIEFMKLRNPFNHMTVAFDVDLVRQCGGYPDIYLREDYALWAVLLKNGAIAKNINEVLVHATAGNGLISRRGGLKYAIGELELQRHLIRCRVKSVPCAVRDGIIRFMVFICPSFVRAAIYRHLLRSELSDSFLKKAESQK